VVYQCGNDGKLTILKHVPTEGNWPRNFAFDPSGKYLLVANQRSHNITVFRLENGIPVFTGKELKIPAPVCIEF
jgi:6-phosphogluconolactonase